MPIAGSSLQSFAAILAGGVRASARRESRRLVTTAVALPALTASAIPDTVLQSFARGVEVR